MVESDPIFYLIELLFENIKKAKKLYPIIKKINFCLDSVVYLKIISILINNSTIKLNVIDDLIDNIVSFLKTIS